MSQFTADIEGLLRASSDFLASADNAEAAYRQVRAEVDGRGAETWGSDEPGGTFGDGYVAAHATTMGNIDDVHQKLVHAANSVREAAQFLYEQDSVTARSLRNNGFGG